MTTPLVTPEQVDPQVLGLAKLLNAHPTAARVLRNSIERQQALRDSARPAPTDHLMNCPHCDAPGVVYVRLPSPAGIREFRRRPSDCCQAALRDCAEAELHFALSPANDPHERGVAADRYAAICKSLTNPVFLDELDAYAAEFDGVEDRITGLTRAQGGQE
ncbi:hypothetical protein [Deinococcus sp. Leaf326]|uniref:hypothetical protein n=1 Tax=Deinococcus sp. Leaf326 TaxID=1736338 RepID=UPI0006F1E871|nr:hypothetical protein [Deinococcus sp. Leaf326]KQR40788.1 hypothetical protein ASF71_01060 [Deinococcus sp. Leaf326]